MWVFITIFNIACNIFSVLFLLYRFTSFFSWLFNIFGFISKIRDACCCIYQRVNESNLAGNFSGDFNRYTRLPDADLELGLQQQKERTVFDKQLDSIMRSDFDSDLGMSKLPHELSNERQFQGKGMSSSNLTSSFKSAHLFPYSDPDM